MDADKLNDAAGKDWCENVLDRDLKPITKQAFKRGANWLIQQPLADRLTEEEKEKIKAIYSESQRWLNEEPNEYNSTLKVIAVGLQDRLERIFGNELFNEK